MGVEKDRGRRRQSVLHGAPRLDRIRRVGAEGRDELSRDRGDGARRRVHEAHGGSVIVHEEDVSKGVDGNIFGEPRSGVEGAEAVPARLAAPRGPPHERGDVAAVRPDPAHPAGLRWVEVILRVLGDEEREVGAEGEPAWVRERGERRGAAVARARARADGPKRGADGAAAAVGEQRDAPNDASEALRHERVPRGGVKDDACGDVQAREGRGAAISRRRADAVPGDVAEQPREEVQAHQRVHALVGDVDRGGAVLDGEPRRAQARRRGEHAAAAAAARAGSVAGDGAH